MIEELLTLERAALDRWLRFDPESYLGIFAPDISYVDPTSERRVDGLDAKRKRLEPMKTISPPFTDPRYEIVGPKVDNQGEMAVLSMNLVSYGRIGSQPECKAGSLSSLRTDKGISETALVEIAKECDTTSTGRSGS